MSYYKNNNNKTIPKKAKQKKGVAFWVVFVLMCFWTVCSVLSICNFIDNKHETRITASADTYYPDSNSFTSSALYFPTSRYIRSTAQVEDNNHVGNFLKMAFSIQRTSATSNVFTVGCQAIANVIPITGNSADATQPNTAYLGIYNGLGNRISQLVRFPSFSFDSTSDNGREFYLGYYVGSSNYNTFSSYLGRVAFYVDPQFNCNPVRVTIDSNFTDKEGGRVINNMIHYYDANGFQFRVTVHKWLNNNQYTIFFRLSDRNYYLEDLPSSGEESSDYIAGLIVGREEGLEEGRGQGYQDGYDRGKVVGEGIGYNKGVEAANNYSFLGLFSALVDVPVKAITSMFDFTILGFSLRQLISSVFTVCVIVLIIRIIIGGGKSD